MTRTLTSLLGNSQRLDGGAMFGNAPKALWSRWVSPDAHNRIPLACRALLIEEAGRRVLFETGIGAFFAPKLRERYGVVEDRHVLIDSLADHGLDHTEIDVVVLSHLHFDHAGGLLTPWKEGQSPELLFPNAIYLVSEAAWARANHPHPRDKASFIPSIQQLLQQSGRLKILAADSPNPLGPGYRFHLSEGHTPGLLLTEIELPGGPVLFCGDLIPAAPWVHIPITMGYDRFPERLIDEKSALLPELHARNGRLFFTHDPDIALASIGFDGRRYRAVDGLPTLTGWKE